MAVRDVISKRAKPFTLVRPGVPVRTEGYAQVPGSDPDEIPVYMQPLSPKEVRDLPPGQNAIDWRNAWSLFELRINDQLTAVAGGDTFTVKRAEYWEEGLFWRAAVTVVKDTL